MILGIETSGAACGVALGNLQGSSIEHKSHEQLNIPQAHSEKLFDMIENLLDQSNVDRKQLTGVAVSIGPGSFTGLRIGLSAAKGLCYALDIPLVGVPTLDIIAANHTVTGSLHVATTSRRKEYYHAVYENGVRHRDIDVLSEVEVAAELEPGGTLICADPSGILASAGAGASVRIVDGDAALPDVRKLLELSAERFENNAVEDLAGVVPLYVQGFKGKIPA